MRRNAILVAVTAALLWTTLVNGEALGTACNAQGCAITVDWSIDEVPGSLNHTCDYDPGGAILFSAPDGKCTFRRALREAGARPLSDHPILIRFSGLTVNGDADDVHYDAVQEVWTLVMSRSASQSRLALVGQGIADTAGDVTVQGPPFTRAANLPSVYIDTEHPIEIEKKDNIIRRLGFFGGGSIQIKQSGNLIEDVTWGLATDGQSIVFQDEMGNADALAGAQGIHVTAAGDDTVVQNSVIAGASTKAIEVSSGTTGIQILDNYIGTRADGTVPPVPANVECQTLDPFVDPPDANDWYGGWAISLAGTGATIEGNLVAGLQNMRSQFDTPPMAIEIFGSTHTVSANTIGEDSGGTPTGVCGQGIKFSGDHHQIVDNVLVRVRAGFENTDGAILWTDDTFTDDGGNTVRRNLSIDGPEKLYEMGPMVGSGIRLFEPAQITGFSGLDVSGTAPPGSGCPNCIVDFYLDDSDANSEALDYLGSATASPSGDFVFQLPHDLVPGQAIRTTSTSQAQGIIPDTHAGTTSEPSGLYQPDFSHVIFVDGFESGSVSSWN